MIEPKPTSRFFVAILNVCIFSAMAVGLSIGLLAYFLTPLPTLKIATEYPAESVVVVEVAEEVSPGEFEIFSSASTQTISPEDPSEPYINLKTSIDQYDHVVTVEHPRRNQVVLREEYPVHYDDGTVLNGEVVVYGNGHIDIIDPYDRPQEEQ